MDHVGGVAMSGTMKYKVREGREDDIPTLIQLGERLHQESAFKHMDYNYVKVATLLMMGIKGQNGLFLRVITNGEDKPVGMLGGQVTTSYFGHDSVANDMSLSIDPPHRGRCFVAIQEVVSQYHKWARENGAKRIYLSTSTGIEAENTAKLYETLGFRKIGTIHEA